MTDLPKKPTWHVQPRMRSRARSLRREMTKAEKIIWYMVRAHRLEGAGFRRQTPIGPYIVDFVSHSSRLIVEIDGGQHFEEQHLKKDARRDAYFATKGYRVLRFTNLDVLTNREGVYTIIAETLGQAPSLPSPASGGGDGTRGDSRR